MKPEMFTDENREKFINENKGKKFDIELSTGEKIKNIEFFMSNGLACYLPSRKKVYGYCIPWYWEVVSITEKKKKEYTDIGNAKTILNKIHPNVWDNLKTEMNDVINGITNNDFKWHFKNRLKFRNVTNLMSPHYRQELIKAFENRTEFSWSNKGKKRDYSIDVGMGEDGVLRAYFSSEYSGCLNGDYYLLLNPTTAIFYETD